MNLPQLHEPQRYRGLYVFDFGEWAAVGYTAEEIAVLLESEAYRDGKVYRIVRAAPDGGLELRGVSGRRLSVESGMFFNRNELAAARGDFDALAATAERTPPPCRAFLHLADRGQHEGVAPFVTALIYPAEFEDDMASWLLAADCQAGDTAEAGISHVTDYYGQEAAVLDRRQLWGEHSTASRSADEVLRSVRCAVQR